MVDHKPVQAKKSKQERLKEKLNRSQKKVRDAKQGEKKPEVFISDLRKDCRLKKKANKTLADLCLVSDSNQTISGSSLSSGLILPTF